MRGSIFGLACAFACTLAACADPSPHPPPAASSTPLTSSASGSSPGASASATPSSSAPGLGGSAFAPPRRDLPKEERERELARILAGDADAPSLPLADTEPGEEFDPLLRRALAMPAVMKLVEITADGAGPPDLERAREAVLGRTSKLRGCYAKGMANNPNLIGTIRAVALLAGAGKPKSVENGGSDLPDGEVLACVIAQVARVSFPAPTSGESRVTIRMSFAPGS